MPWLEVDAMSQKRELVALAQVEGANRALLAERFGVSRQTLYKWLARARQGQGLDEKSRRPRSSPRQTSQAVEAEVLAWRDGEFFVGPRKIHTRMLGERGVKPKGRHPDVPSLSTIAAILVRRGRIPAGDDAPPKPFIRFEPPTPNDLWQMDFKGHFPLSGGQRCHPLGVIDDHSRFALVAHACPQETGDFVRPALSAAFERYGLPRQMLADNGPPWGCGGALWTYTRLEVWLMDQDVSLIHGRPFHPQTQGKEERLNGTMNLEALQGRHFDTFAAVQTRLDRWREYYNHERPHDALGLYVPATRYAPSPRSYNPRPPAPEYPAGDKTRVPNPVGQLSYGGKTYKLCEAFGSKRLALRPMTTDGLWSVHYRTFHIADLDEREGSCTMR